MNLKPLGKNIIFVFAEDSQDGMFVPQSKAGIILTNKNMEHNHVPKWGKVLAKGPDVSEHIKIGEFVLIEPLQWTLGSKFDGRTIWKTDETKVMAMSSENLPAY